MADASHEYHIERIFEGSLIGQPGDLGFVLRARVKDEGGDVPPRIDRFCLPVIVFAFLPHEEITVKHFVITKQQLVWSCLACFAQ